MVNWHHKYRNGVRELPFGNQSSEYDIGFPSFSNLTDRYIAFDLIHYTAEADNGVGNSLVMILDTRRVT